MAMEYESGYCNNCEADKKVERKGTSHIFHLLMTVILGIFTAGVGAMVWIIIWVLSSIKFGGWMCSTCGNKNVQVKPSYTKMAIYIIIAVFLVAVIQNMQGV